MEEQSESALENPGQRGGKVPYGLTSRELTVLRLLAGGLSDKEIARDLEISKLTVHKHVANILTKMKAASRTEASVRALREGIVEE